MAIAKYISKNKKKSLGIATGAILLLLASFIIIHTMNTKAGVFVKDESGDWVQTNEINILEIVADEGQQVLGYTVAGQEPISKQQIESYKGPDILDGDNGIKDFMDATGYIVDKVQNSDGTFSYKVKNNVLNDTFNLNVLDGSMAKGEIKVKVILAKDLRISDVEKANLVYINSNDSNDNLLFYYDQFTKGGSLGYEKGDKGHFYNSIEETEELKSTIAIKKIASAAGIRALADELTIDDFKTAGLEYEERHLTMLRNVIAESEIDEFYSENIEETLEMIAAVLYESYTKEQTDAFEYIKNNIAGKNVHTEEEKNNFDYYITICNCSGINLLNVDEYFEEVLSLSSSMTESGLQGAINSGNANALITSVKKIYELKANEKKDRDDFEEYEIEDSEGNTITISEYSISEEYRDELSVCLRKMGIEDLRDYLDAEFAYANAIFSDDFVMTDPSDEEVINEAVEQVKEVIKNVNDESREAALMLIANSPKNPTNINLLKEDNGWEIFRNAELPNYYYELNDKYIEKIETITNRNYFKSRDDLSKYDINTINKFFDLVNSENSIDKARTIIKYDMSWPVAMSIYKYAMTDSGKGYGALMYNTQLLTDGQLGDYNDIGSVDNTNNLYKMLLVLRQLKPEYFMDNYLPSIDGRGVYSVLGIDEEGNPITVEISSWDKETFGTDYANVGNGGKYHEPDVVGDTYDDNGNKADKIDYVYRHTYSFTGAQFFGGKQFVGTDLDGAISSTGVVTSDANYEYEKYKYLYLDAGLVNWNSAVVKFSTNQTGEQVFNMEHLGNKKYRVKVPKTCTYNTVVFAPDSHSSKTSRMINLPPDWDGYQYIVVGEINESGYKYYSVQVLKKFTRLNGALQGNINNGGYYAYLYPEVYGWGSSASNTVNLNCGAYLKRYKDNLSQLGTTEYLLMDKSPYSDQRYQSAKSGNSIPKYVRFYRSNKSGAERTQYVLYGRSRYYTLEPTSEIEGAVERIIVSSSEYSDRTISDTPAFTGIKIKNFIENGGVQFYDKMTMEVSFTEISDVQYSVAGGEFKSVNSGDIIEIGAEMSEGTDALVVFKFNEGTVEKQVSGYVYKLPKLQAGNSANYLSKACASSIDITKQVKQPNAATYFESKAKIIEYIMDVSMLKFKYPLQILDIEPAASTSTLSNKKKALELADMLGLNDIKANINKNDTNYKKYFNIKSMSVREFNTRNYDLASEFDLVYIGIDSGYLRLNSKGRTDYIDNSMDGLVYTGIGDEYYIEAFLRGTASEDYVTVPSINNGTQKVEHGYWTQYLFDGFSSSDPKYKSWNLDPSKYYILKTDHTKTRTSGFDLTIRSMDSLLQYVKAGYPVLMADEVFNCDDSKYIPCNMDLNDSDKWRYVDPYSKMWAFVKEVKSLGKNEAGIYTGVDGEKYVFADKKTYPSIVSWSNAKSGKNPENLPDSQKLDGGLKYAMKRVTRVEFTIDSNMKPKEYQEGKNSTTYIGTTILKSDANPDNNYKKYAIKLNVSGNVTQQFLEENYYYQLYIDKSGSGQFVKQKDADGNYVYQDVISLLDPSEKYRYVEYVLRPNTNYVESVIIRGEWPQGLEGFVPWKLEAYNKDNVELKYAYIGYSAFERIKAEKRDVYVLWVRTHYNNDKPYNLNFTQAVIDNNKYIEEYNIHILSLEYKEFVDMYSGMNTYRHYGTNKTLRQIYNEKGTLLTVGTVAGYMDQRWGNGKDGHNGHKGYGFNVDSNDLRDLDESLNMIVFGFSDSYVGEDLNNVELHKDLKKFVDDGNSFFFSHDGASFVSTLNAYNSVNGNSSVGHNWGKYSTSFLRTILGQDLFGIMHSYENLLDYEKSARAYLSPNIKQSDLRGYTDMVTFIYGGRDSNPNAVNSGNALYMKNKYSSDPNNVSTITDWVRTTTVAKINKGQITEYPFVLSDSVKTAQTHCQYMLLNMEDTETVVWYVLDASSGYYNYTKGDGANNYYIYSKGNVTYTGSGHESGITTDEQKLFINTTLAALKIGNFTPILEFPESSKGTTDPSKDYIPYYKNNENFDGLRVTFRATDYDLSANVTDAYTECQIFFDVNGDGVYDSGDILLNDSIAGGTSTSNYICDVNTLQPVVIKADEIHNRVNTAFVIPFEKMDEIEAILTGKGISLENCPLVVKIVDNGKKGKNKATVTERVYIKETEYIQPDWFQLN